MASLLVFLVKRDVLDKPEFSSVRHIWTGAAPLSPKLQQLVLQKLAGRALLHHSYGLTETTFTMFTCTVDNFRLGTPGKVTPGMECKVCYIFQEQREKIIRITTEVKKTQLFFTLLILT